jgi:hypothetical protein
MKLLADSGQCTVCGSFGWRRAYQIHGRGTVCEPCHARLVAEGRLKPWRKPQSEDQLVEATWAETEAIGSPWLRVSRLAGTWIPGRTARFMT